MSGFFQNNVRDPRSQVPDFLELCINILLHYYKQVVGVKSFNLITLDFFQPQSKVLCKFASDSPSNEGLFTILFDRQMKRYYAFKVIVFLEWLTLCT